MGQYIKIGLCTQFVIEQSEVCKIKKYYDDVGEFFQIIESQKHLNINLFDFEQVENKYIFSIKDEILEQGSLLSFLKMIMSDMHDQEYLDEFANALYKDVTMTQSTIDMIELAKEKKHYNFQIDQGYDWIGAPFSTSIELKFEYIALGLYGKTMMESYSDLFLFMENLIRAKYQVIQVGAVKIFLN